MAVKDLLQEHKNQTHPNKKQDQMCRIGSIHILEISVMLTADENRPPIINYKNTKIFNIF